MNVGGDVAILFDDMTEFYCLQNGIDDCIKRGIDVDIIVPKNSGYNGLSEYTYKGIKKLGYNVKYKPSKKKYKVIMEPYDLASLLPELKYEYRLKYRYGLLQLNKPMTLTPEWNIWYDAILSFSRSEMEFLSAYSRVELTSPTNFRGFTRSKNKHSKKRLLILPTFGQVSCVDNLTDEVISQIKKQYHIIIKAHHAIQFRTEERSRRDKLAGWADEFYDQNRPVSELLKDADVVLSDASGAIFDAIYTDTPVVVFAKEPDQGKFKNIHTIQSKLIADGKLCSVKNADDIVSMFAKAQDNIDIQQDLRHELFDNTGCQVSSFVEIVDRYLHKNADQDLYHKVHRVIVDDYVSKCEKINKLTNDLNNKEQIIKQLMQDKEAILRSTSWKITAPIRSIKNKIDRLWRHVGVLQLN